VARLGERSPERRALAAREIERLSGASAHGWEPLTADQVAAELGRVFGSIASAHHRERSAVIAEALADADPAERSPAPAVAQALGLSHVSARREIARYRGASAQALGERTAVSAR
jgi:hypothetical protein